MPLIPLFTQYELNADAAENLSAWNWCNPFDHILPHADSAVSALDRQHLWGLYSGVASQTVGFPGMGYTLTGLPNHYTTKGKPIHYTHQINRTHYATKGLPLHFDPKRNKLHYTL